MKCKCEYIYCRSDQSWITLYKVLVREPRAFIHAKREIPANRLNRRRLVYKTAH